MPLPSPSNGASKYVERISNLGWELPKPSDEKQTTPPLQHRGRLETLEKYEIKKPNLDKILKIKD